MTLNVMLYGAALSALLAAILVTLVTLPFRPRRISTVLTAATSAFLGPVSWNWVLRSTGATGAFSHDAPVPPMPISWQDVGSAVTTLALAGVLLGLGPLHANANANARRSSVIALLSALAALLIDVYLY
jgi:hypothetical protein